MNEHHRNTLARMRRMGYSPRFIRQTTTGQLLVAVDRKTRLGVLILRIMPSGAWVDNDRRREFSRGPGELW